MRRLEKRNVGYVPDCLALITISLFSLFLIGSVIAQEVTRIRSPHKIRPNNYGEVIKIHPSNPHYFEYKGRPTVF